MGHPMTGMRRHRLVLRSLAYFWRTNIAIVLGVATAVAVLAGALLVGDSVRGSLRDLVLQRLGRTDLVVASPGFFREQLAADLRADQNVGARIDRTTPLVVVQGVVTAQESGRRAGQVRVYGVDDRFWRFHGVDAVSGPSVGDALLSPSLARHLGAESGSTVLVRVERPSDVPLESLHGRKEDVGRTLRLSVGGVIPASSLGEFSLEARQDEVRAVFVPLAQLQDEIEAASRVNTILVSVRAGAPRDAAALQAAVRDHVTLEDLGLTVTTLEAPRAVVVGADAGLLNDAHLQATRAALTGTGMEGEPIFTYLANALRHGGREVPYSLVTAMDAAMAGRGSRTAGGQPPAIVLNEWAAEELGAIRGDPVAMEYYVWEDPGRLVSRTAEFRVLDVVPTDFGDRHLAPPFRGITDSATLTDWDPPFPIDLRRIRALDEEYWERYRTTPKAFIDVETGRRLWSSRHGALTSIRIRPPSDRPVSEVRDEVARRLRATVVPLVLGLAVRDVWAEGLEASRGATDFGAYFVYFSVFLVASALLLAALFFKLGIEQRSREVGLLRAVGFDHAAVRRLFTGEGLLLAIAGSALGVLGAVGYAWLMMLGLRSWWVGAVGTTALTLHVSGTSLAAGALGGIGAAMGCIWWTLRALTRVSERRLLMGQITPEAPDLQGAIGPEQGRPPRAAWRRRPAETVRLRIAAVALAIVAVALIAAAVAGMVARTGAFFGGGAALLVAALCGFAVLFRRPTGRALGGRGWQAVARLGFRNASYRPGRSVLSMAVMASATFVLISVDAFRRDDLALAGNPRSGIGGYTLIVETLLPVVHDPNAPAGRDALNLFDLEDVTFEPFRLLPGDDASCLNLYAPRNPRILAPRDSFLTAGRFLFQDSLASSDAEAANPWLLLNRVEPDGAVPVIADANSMTYVLHRRLGEDIVITRGERRVRLRLVAALRDSIFQRELLMSQANFLTLFPEQAGYQVLLVEASPDRAAAVGARIEDALADFGADATGAAERLAEFHRVENTYLSTFQTLGGLGLLLGTVGLATVLLRNALERRRELALLGAVGYRRGHFLLMVAAENALLLAGGLAAGAACAALAIAPALVERGGAVPVTSVGTLLLFAVLVTGGLSSIIAARVATRAPLLESLKSE